MVFAADTNKVGNTGRTVDDWDSPQDVVPNYASLSADDADYQTAKWYAANWIPIDFTDVDASGNGWKNKGVAYRHNRIGGKSGIANFVFCDGHVKSWQFGKVKLSTIFAKKVNYQDFGP